MYYCTLQDIQTQISKASLIQLTNDSNLQDKVDADVVSEALSYASSLIDGYLRGNYNLPLNTQFPLLKVLAIDLSIYRLYTRRIQIETPEPVVEGYKNAIKTLEQIKKGVISLQADETSTTTQLTSSDYRTNKTKLDKMFNKRRINEY